MPTNYLYNFPYVIWRQIKENLDVVDLIMLTLTFEELPYPLEKTEKIELEFINLNAYKDAVNGRHQKSEGARHAGFKMDFKKIGGRQRRKEGGELYMRSVKTFNNGRELLISVEQDWDRLQIINRLMEKFPVIKNYPSRFYINDPNTSLSDLVDLKFLKEVAFIQINADYYRPDVVARFLNGFEFEKKLEIYSLNTTKWVSFLEKITATSLHIPKSDWITTAILQKLDCVDIHLEFADWFRNVSQIREFLEFWKKQTPRSRLQRLCVETNCRFDEWRHEFVVRRSDGWEAKCSIPNPKLLEVTISES